MKKVKAFLGEEEKLRLCGICRRRVLHCKSSNGEGVTAIN